MRTGGSVAFPGEPRGPTNGGQERAGAHAMSCPAADMLSRSDLTPVVAEKSHHLEGGLMRCHMTESIRPGQGPEGPWGALCPTCLSVPSPCKEATEGPHVPGFRGPGSPRWAVWLAERVRSPLAGYYHHHSGFQT